jgi:copper chaperone CopZ
MATKTFKIADMHCTSCAMRLEGIEDDLPGIKKISASYVKATLQVEFDERKVSEEQILEAVRGKGYTAIQNFEH